MPAGKPHSEPTRGAARARLWPLGWIVLWALWASGAVAEGPILHSMEVRTVDRSSGLNLEAMIEVEVGEPLDPAAVRRTLSNCHAAGWFSDVGWWVRSHADGSLHGILVLEPHARVRHIEFLGEPALRERRLRRVLVQKESAVLEPDAIERSEQALRELYREEGYFEAVVSSELRPGRRPWNDWVLHVQSGPRADIAKITFEGDTGPYKPDDLRAALRSRTGESFRHERVQDDGRRLRRFLAERGHFQAVVQPARQAYDAATDSVSLSFAVEAGPVFELEISGAELRKLKRGGFLPFLNERAFDELLLTQSCARLRRHYQSKGHYRAVVHCSVDDETADPRRVAIRVDQGPELEIEAVRFPGAERVSELQLRSLVRTGPGSWWTPGQGRLVGEELEADTERLLSYYLLEGFSRAKVGPVHVLEVGNKLLVDIPIEEGPRRQVVGLKLAGSSAIAEEELSARLPLRPGGGFHPLLLEDAINLIRTLHEEEGYASTVVTPHLDWDEDSLLVDIVLHVEAGPQRVLDRLVLRGLQHTQPELIRRFADLDSGDVLSRRRLLQAERDLYRLGVFSEVDVDLAPSAALSSQRDVRIRLREGRRWRLAYGVSYHSDDGIGGLFGLTRSKFAWPG